MLRLRIIYSKKGYLYVKHLRSIAGFHCESEHKTARAQVLESEAAARHQGRPAEQMTSKASLSKPCTIFYSETADNTNAQLFGHVSNFYNNLSTHPMDANFTIVCWIVKPSFTNPQNRRTIVARTLGRQPWRVAATWNPRRRQPATRP